MLSEIRTGAVVSSDGAVNPARSDKTGAIITADGHGRFQEAALRGVLFSGGMTLTSISSPSFSTGTLSATCSPIAGVWNPLNSGKNLIILQVKVSPINTAAQVTGAGALMWASSIGNAAISTGNAPFNRGTGLAVGSVAKDMSGVLLTGLTNSLVVRDAAALAGGLLSNLSTLVTTTNTMAIQVVSVDNIDGSIIVPPGGVLALLCTTNPPVAISMASSILWEEVSI